jgi:hypothetical protein
VDKAKEILLLGKEVSGTDAERLGLVNRAVAGDELMPTALEWAATITGLPRRGVRTTLGYLQLQADMSKRDALRWAQLTPGFMAWNCGRSGMRRSGSSPTGKGEKNERSVRRPAARPERVLPHAVRNLARVRVVVSD